MSERERWAFASMLLEHHGAAIGDFVEQRIACLSECGDEEGLILWRDITDKLLMLLGPMDGGRTQ